MIGVHLRRGDFVRRQPDVIANTAAALGAVDRYLEQSPNAGIFLSTDDGGPDQVTGRTSHEGVREQFSKRYGTRVVWTMPRTLDRRNPIAVEDAVVDLWLLRQTSMFVGTRLSSFSTWATFGRTVDATFCGAPTAQYRRMETWARRTGIGAVLRMIPLPSRPVPGSSFATVWAYYASLPRAVVRRVKGQRW